MPLSEHEQRQLEQIEQALYADHPRLAKIMRAKDPKVHYRRRVILAAIGFVVGAGVVVAGFFLKYTWLYAAGFVVMLASSGWAVSSYRRMSVMLMNRGRTRAQAGGRSGGRGRRPAKPAPSGGLMERLEERWRRRQEGNR